MMQWARVSRPRSCGPKFGFAAPDHSKQCRFNAFGNQQRSRAPALVRAQASASSRSTPASSASRRNCSRFSWTLMWAIPSSSRGTDIILVAVAGWTSQSAPNGSHELGETVPRSFRTSRD